MMATSAFNGLMFLNICKDKYNNIFHELSIYETMFNKLDCCNKYCKNTLKNENLSHINLLNPIITKHFAMVKSHGYKLLANTSED